MASVKTSSTTSSSRRSTTGAKNVPIDNRPIRDRAYMEQEQHNINEYLQSKGYPQILGPKSLISPTKKDFESIFKFLYNRIDPQYEYGKKFEDDVAYIIRQSLKYPFADSISKSSLHAVGSVQSWPHILAMLDYFVEYLKCCDKMDEKLAMDQYSEGWDSNPTFKILLKAYKLKFQSATDEEVEKDIRAFYAQKEKKINAECQKLESHLETIKAQSQALVSKESPLTAVQQRRNEIEEEQKALEERLEENKKEQHLLYNATLEFQQELQRLNEVILELNAQKMELEKRLDTQEIKREEAEKLAKERVELTMLISNREEECEKLVVAAWESEVLYKSHLKQIESLVMEFNKVTSEVGISCELTVNPRASDPKDMVKYEHLRPQLLQLRNAWNEELKQAQHTSSSLNDRLNATTEALSEADLKVIKIQRELKVASENYIDMKLRFEDETTSMITQINELGQETKASKDSLAADLKIWETWVQKIQLEFDRVLKEHEQAKEYMAIELHKQATDMADLKNHTESLLKALAAEVHAVEVGEGALQDVQSSKQTN